MKYSRSGRHNNPNRDHVARSIPRCGLSTARSPRKRFLEGKPVIIEAVSELICRHLSDTIYAKFVFEDSRTISNSLDIALKGSAYDGSSKSYSVGYILMSEDALTIHGGDGSKTTLLYADPNLEDNVGRQLIVLYTESCKKLSKDRAFERMSSRQWGAR